MKPKLLLLILVIAWISMGLSTLHTTQLMCLIDAFLFYSLMGITVSILYYIYLNIVYINIF